MLECLLFNRGSSLQQQFAFFANFADLPAQNSIVDKVTGSIYSSTADKSAADDLYAGAYAGYFDGSDRILVDATGMHGAEDYTAEAWVKADPSAAGRTMIFFSNMNNAGGGSATGWFSYGCGDNSYIYTATRYGVSRATTVTMKFGVWVHVCLMRKDNVIYVFLDGELINSFSQAGAIAQAQFSIGSYRAGSLRNFKGFIASFAMSKEARYPITGFTPTKNLL